MRKVVAVLLLLGCFTPATGLAQQSRSEHGVATVYAQKLIGHRTASGERIDRVQLTAAHRTLPIGTIVEVTNRENGRTATVRINDRGPHRRRVLIDLSPAAAAALGISPRASAPVELRVVKSP